MSTNAIKNLEILSNQEQCKFQGLYGLDFFKSQPCGAAEHNATSRCGSVAESGTDDEGDIINVTDDDEVVSPTTDSSLPENLQFKKTVPASQADQSKTGARQSNKIYQRRPKPPFSYIALIAMAIRDSANGKLTLAEINEYLMKRFPFFRGPYTGWRNSVRHNLSLNECFQKVLRDPSRPWGKDNFWTINPNSEYTFADGVFRRRRKRISRKLTTCSSLYVTDSMSTSPTPTVMSSRSSSADDSRSDFENSSSSPVPFSIESILAKKDPKTSPKPSLVWQQVSNHVPMSPYEAAPLHPYFISPTMLGYKPHVLDSLAYQQLLHVQAMQTGLIGAFRAPEAPTSPKTPLLNFYHPAGLILAPRMVSV